MFRRHANAAEKSDPETARKSAPKSAGSQSDGVDGVDGKDASATKRSTPKGRPTPSRKEAEAAARARAKPARGRKELAARERAKNAELRKKQREGMKTGEEKYLLPRDKGPVRRLVRDVVDTRFGFTELILPLMVLSLIMQYSGSADLASTGQLIFLMLFVLVALDMVWIRFRVRREVARRFPDHDLKKIFFYAISRSMQIKPWRMPKARLKIGQPLPEDYHR